MANAEYLLQHTYLKSRPRCLGLVLSNRCNIGCIHCYQAKNGDDLLQPAAIGRELRREFQSLYPFLSTLRVQGGEVFALAGFRELLEDVRATVDRPLVSISTNGLLIDEDWAETLVRLPASNLTFSIDGATPETYRRLRRGGELETVLTNMRRVQDWKTKLESPYPFLDAFFVIMRSNFREVPRFVEMMSELGVGHIAFQTVLINPQNSGRFPMLESNESIDREDEVRELYELIREAKQRFERINVSGLESLFQRFGLDAAFLEEGSRGLYPNSADLRPAELCPNPWTTMFVTEDGSVFLCFLSEPIGNLYDSPLEEIWNSPAAVSKRKRMLNGRYLESGCSEQWCGWREGQQAQPVAWTERDALMAQVRELAAAPAPGTGDRGDAPAIRAVRRMLAMRDERIEELRATATRIEQETTGLLEAGQKHIDHLEQELAHARAVAERRGEQLAELEKLRDEGVLAGLRRHWSAWRAGAARVESP